MVYWVGLNICKIIIFFVTFSVLWQECVPMVTKGRYNILNEKEKKFHDENYHQ